LGEPLKRSVGCFQVFVKKAHMQKVSRREFSNLMLLSVGGFKTPVAAQTGTGDEATIRQVEQRLVVASLDE